MKKPFYYATRAAARTYTRERNKQRNRENLNKKTETEDIGCISYFVVFFIIIIILIFSI